MAIKEVKLEGIGDVENIEVVEVLVSAGDEVKKEDPLVTLESDKATMEFPSPYAGKIKEVKVSKNQQVEPGAVLCTIEVVGEKAEAGGEKKEPEKPTPGERKEAEGRKASIEEEQAKPAEDSMRRETAEKEERRPARGREREHEFDLVILGAGPGGYEAAQHAGEFGLKTALIDKRRPGGVCLWEGCVPSKALIDTAHHVQKARELGNRGISLDGDFRIDFGKTQEWKDGILDKLSGFIEKGCEKLGVEIVRGSGKLTGPNEIRVEGENGERTLGFDHLIIATGSRPIELPDVPFDGEKILSSTHALALREIPKKMVVVGGGYIGLELGITYHKLGSQVQVVELQGQLLPGTDSALVRPLSRRAKDLGIEIHLESKVKSFKSGKVTIEGKNGKETGIEAEKVLVAVGRRPNSQEIGLEAAGVDSDEKGYIPTDDQKRTNVDHIFAIGDVTHGPALAHKASAEGLTAVEVIAGLPARFDPLAIPAVIFTDPEISYVGMTETEAKDAGYSPKVSQLPARGHGRALAADETEGITRLIYDEESGRLLGAQLAGGPATDMVGSLGLAVELGADIEDVALTIYPHPTFSEQVMIAAQRAVHPQYKGKLDKGD